MAAIASPVVSVVSGGLLTVLGVGVVALAMPEFARLDMRTAGEATATDAAT